tara:strand:+ start:316 stop:1002 length:687 start_codon:yes stop_codon:yes gene_type:complete
MLLNENLHFIKNEIASIQSKQNLDHFVEIVAATKTRSFQTINDIYECGIRHIGENRIQEAYQKFGSFDLMPNITKRFIGHLQTNKVNRCLELFDTIDSVDSIKLAEKINNRLFHLKKTIPILLEINTSGDKSKKGFSPKINEDFFSIFNYKNIEIIGLMTMGPFSQGEKETRESFSLLRKTKNLINSQLTNQSINELSMGMSGDYRIGIQEGSTMIRVGTKLFGKRNY